jgi:serine/threonine protein kinase
VIGQTLGGRFTVVGLVGVGSMGKVYRAVQRGTERSVALKVLRPERAREGKAKARFLREARACSSLASPHTVRVFDFGESDEGELFLAMELLEGESLAQRLRRDGRLGLLASIETTLAALKSLEEAHAKGLIHRDLKPANLFYARVATGGGGFDEILKVLDFGGAKFIAPEGKPMNAMDTLEGFVVGTPRYMSPEQAEGKALDGRSDLYSLAAVLYHMLTGRAPFTDDDPELVLAKQIRTTPDLPSVACPAAEIPHELESILMRTLAKNRDLRPKDATALSHELAAFVDGPPSTRLSSGVLRASIPAPASAQTQTPAPAVSAPGSPAAQAGSGRSMRTSLPSIPSISSSSNSGPAKLSPSTPGAFAPPGASSSGSSRSGASSSGPAASAGPDAAEPPVPDAPPEPETLQPPIADPRRPRASRWLGMAGAVGVIAAMTWFASTATSPEAVSPAAQPSSATARASPVTLQKAATKAAVATAIPDGARAVPVEALPRVHFEGPPPRAVLKARPPVAPATAKAAENSASPPPPPAAPSATASTPAAATPPASATATASSPYHYFE